MKETFVNLMDLSEYLGLIDMGLCFININALYCVLL